MRLIQGEDGAWKPQFTLAWEVMYLLEQGECWVPFCLNGHTTPIGEIHAETHEIHLYPGIQIANRQAVVLAPPAGNGEIETGQGTP